MVNRNLFMSRKKMAGTNPTGKQWPKIWRHCHRVRMEKLRIKEEKLEMTPVVQSELEITE